MTPKLRSALRVAAGTMAVAFVLTATTAGRGQSPAATPAPYRPGLGDLMTMTVQPRHVKLFAAGREQNWHYAAYELHELQEAFERVERVWPRWREIAIADTMDALIKGPVASLEAAIKAGDAERFKAGYDELTQACNACHQGAARGFVVIQVPDAAPFPDQDFHPH